MEPRFIDFTDLPALDVIIAEGFCDWSTASVISVEDLLAYSEVTGILSPDAKIPGPMILSLLPRIMPPLSWKITGYSGGVNLGCPEYRFPVPVKTGSAVSGRSRLVSAKSTPQGTVIKREFEARQEGCALLCLTAMVEILYLGAQG